jgi:uncharacterized membrane protein (UPF0127 family)
MDFLVATIVALAAIAFIFVLWFRLRFRLRFRVQPAEGFRTYTNNPIKGTFQRNGQVLLQVDLELARTPKEIEQGLMHRTHLAPNSGMLFWFEDEVERSFWMRNTLISLDMIFVNSAGRITNIEASVPPQNDTLRRSKEPVQYVVEVPGGTAAIYGIQAGDRFAWNQ